MSFFLRLLFLWFHRSFCCSVLLFVLLLFWKQNQLDLFHHRLVWLRFLTEKFFPDQKTFQHYNRRDEENNRSLLSSNLSWFLFWNFWMSDQFILQLHFLSPCLLLSFSLIFKAIFLENSTGKLCSHQEIYPGFLIAFVCKNRNSTFFFLPIFSKFSNLFICTSPISKKS